MQLVKNAELLTKIFGRWPSFHDAEIISIFLTREGVDSPSVELKIHVFEMTREVDNRGYYLLKNHTTVMLRFKDISEDIQIASFNHQNSIASLEFNQTEATPARLRVEIPSNYGA